MPLFFFSSPLHSTSPMFACYLATQEVYLVLFIRAQVNSYLKEHQKLASEDKMSSLLNIYCL